MVIHDLQNMPGFEHIRSTQFGSAVFESDSSTLTIILANRLPLEQQLGVDLIYYNETYEAFVMVQYKAMEHSSEGPIFRLPNPQLTDELARMQSVLEELEHHDANTEARGYRLTENPFFLKLCSRVTFNPDDQGLFPGMYLPLAYWRHLEQDPTLVGPLGGRQITYRNVRRYLDNTAFATLVANAWVGTTISQSHVLSLVVRAVIESGRALVWATRRERTQVPARDGG